MEGGDDKFEQISGIFSQFSEDSKDKLLEIAKGLLEAQSDSQDETRGGERCSKEK